MKKHGLQINIGTVAKPDWQWAVTNDDLELNITDINAIFDTQYGGAVSLEFEFDCRVNKHIVGNAYMMKGAHIHDVLYGKRFRLFFDGVPVMYGFIWIDQEVEVEDGIVPIALKSNNRDLNERLEGVKANDVPIETMDPTVIGVCNDQANASKIDFEWKYKNIHITFDHRGNFTIKYDSDTTYPDKKTIDNIGFPTLMYPTYIDARGKEYDYTNVDRPYPAAKFCNIRLCAPMAETTGRTEERTSSSTGYSSFIHTTNKRVEVNVLRYDREHSSPCFYVLYWLDMLCKSLEITIARNDMLKVLDLRRLAFYNTRCFYNNTDFPGDGSSFMVRDNPRGGSDRDNPTSASTHHYTKFTDILQYKGLDGKPSKAADEGILNNLIYDMKGAGTTVAAKIIVESRCKFEVKAYSAIATGANFPDTEASAVIDSLRNAFGLRTLYNSEQQSLELIFIKDILNAQEVEDVACVVNACSKTETQYEGVRVKYSQGAERNVNSITGERELTGTKDKSEDTTFDYYDYTNVEEFREYGHVVNSINAYNSTCYIDNVTGNAYRVKNDKDAKESDKLYPSLIEVGTFRPAEYGKCLTDGRIKEITIGFSPVVPNDANGTEIIAWFRENGDTKTDKTPSPAYAELVDIEIGAAVANRVWYDISTGSFLPATKSKINGANNPNISIGLYLYLEDSWSLTDNIETPLQQSDPGFALGIMRGSGSEAGYQIIEENYDQEGHQSWAYIAGGSDQYTSDSINVFGDQYDYNGSAPGLGYGDDTPISLKLKAEKPYQGGMKAIDEMSGKEYIVTDSLLPLHPDGSKVYYDIDSQHAKRGLVDRLLLEEIYFWLHCRVATFSVTLSLATLLALDKKKKYRINGIQGWIKKITYKLNMLSGLRDVVIEMYYI